MTINPAFEGVPFLIPARVHRSREAVARATLVDLAMLIGALPTAISCLADADLSYADLDTAKAWARSVIRALPTSDMGDAEDGTC
jgi:hypothetical protein